MSSPWNRPAASQLAFGLLLGCCAAMILRPAELFPVLDVLPIYESLIVGALVCGVPIAVATKSKYCKKFSLGNFFLSVMA